jgi:hypothetical protein
LEAEAQEWSPASARDIRRLLQDAIPRILDEICSQKGVWRRAVTIASKAVDLGSWITPFGAYDVSAFIRPRQTQLKARMIIDAKGIGSRLAKAIPTAATIVSSKNENSSIDKTLRFPNRAKWLDDRLRERGWGPQALQDNQGPNRKTTSELLKGMPARPVTLDKLAVALSKKFNEVACGGIPTD